MKNLTKTFLTVNKWVSLGVGCFSGLMGFIDLIRLIVAACNNYVGPVGGFISSLIFCAAGLVSFFVLSPKAISGFESAKSKADAKNPGIIAIVSGALGGLFGIPAGIFMLIMDDSNYTAEVKTEKVAEAKAEEDKKEVAEEKAAE